MEKGPILPYTDGSLSDILEAVGSTWHTNVVLDVACGGEQPTKWHATRRPCPACFAAVPKKPLSTVAPKFG